MIPAVMNLIRRELILCKNSLFQSGSTNFPWLSRTHVSSCSFKSAKTKPTSQKLQAAAQFKQPEIIAENVRHGQPTNLSHPHRLQEGEVVPGMRLAELRARRHRLMESIESFSTLRDLKRATHLVVIPSSYKKFMTEKIPYVFRQNSDFLYLTGCMEPDSVLVMTCQQKGIHESVIFLRGSDPHSELWDGPRTGIEEGKVLFGVDKSLPVNDFQLFITHFMTENRDCMLWYDFISDIHPQVDKTMKEFLSQSWSKIWESPRSLIHQLRLYKSPAEQELMKKSCEIGAKAISETMAQSRPGENESQIFARVDFECRMLGAEYLAYVPVVAGGERANIIHYIDNNQLVQDGEMVLMDAGCEYHGYTSDITRTWPISGKFTPAQRALYEVVQSVQLELIKMCYSFPTLNELYSAMCNSLGSGLRDISAFPTRLNRDEERSKVVQALCPHHVSHYLGMDVHDTSLIPRNIPLEPGMVITVEPGVYVTRNSKLVNPAYHGMGIRIEDDILITESGPVVLTHTCPKHPDDIEKLIKL